MAPENIKGIIQTVYKKHLDKTGHFVLTQSMVEDVTNENRQNLIITKEHERAHRGMIENENQIK